MLLPFCKRIYEKVRGGGGGGWGGEVGGGGTAYEEFTQGSAHARNLIILCTRIAYDMTVVHKVNVPLYLFPLLKYTVLYKNTSKHMGTPAKLTPPLSVTRNSDVTLRKRAYIILTPLNPTFI